MNIAEITVSGNLGQDPEIKEVNGTKVANFSIAVNENNKDRNGEAQEKVHWFNVEAWDGKNDSGVVTNVIEKHCTAGTTVYVRGFPKIDTYEKEGVTHKAFKIKIAGYASQIRLAGRKSEGGASETTTSKVKENAKKSKEPLDDSIPF